MNDERRVCRVEEVNHFDEPSARAAPDHDPLLGVHAAVTRQVTVAEALRCYTANNAYAMHRENEIGRIAPGMLADLVVLSDDLFTIALDEIPKVRVDFTIFDGQTIYERRN